MISIPGKPQTYVCGGGGVTYENPEYWDEGGPGWPAVQHGEEELEGLVAKAAYLRLLLLRCLTILKTNPTLRNWKAFTGSSRLYGSGCCSNVSLESKKKKLKKNLLTSDRLEKIQNWIPYFYVKGTEKRIHTGNVKTANAPWPRILHYFIAKMIPNSDLNKDQEDFKNVNQRQGEH